MKKKIALVLCATSLFIGCGDKKVPNALDKNDTSSDVLVRVNGKPITDVDLAVTTEKVFSRGIAGLYANEINQKALESMVMMMAISQDSEQKATEDELQQIESKTQRYREELLTELYMRKFADVTPPTEVQITEYYNTNKALFGEKAVKQFELVRTISKPKGSELKTQLEQLGKLDAGQWKKMTQQLKNQKGIFEVVSAATDIPNIEKELLRSINSLNEGEVSKVIYLDEKPHVIKVVKVSTKSATPLAEVRTRIRKTLAAKKLKQYIKEVSVKILADADVQYVDGGK